LLQQLIFRLFDYSAAALAEMMVRNEFERLFHRFRSLISISASAGVFAAIFFVLCNQPFVRWWTGGKIAWSVTNDLLLAIWLVVTVLVHAHIGLAGQTKQFRFMRYVYFCEGLFFIGLTSIFLSRAKFPAMITASIVSTLLFSFPYGIWRTSRYFGVSWREVVAGWNRPAWRLLVMLVPLGGVLYYLARSWPPLPQLAVYVSVAATLGAWLFVRWGLNEEIRNEMRLRVIRCWSAVLN
jgi:hypothetical protein